MNTFQILLIICLALTVIALTFLCVILSKKLSVQRTRDAILSHRELWLYYLNNPDLSGLLSNNNGKQISNEINPDKLTEKQYRFLVLFLNHMESMLPSYKKYEKDWIGLFKNPSLKSI